MRLTAIVTALAAVLMGGSLQAAPTSSTFDFARFADGEVIGGIPGFEENWNVVVTGGWLTSGGIRVTASGTYEGREANAFLDSSSGGKPAGLGVCHKKSCTTGVKGADTADDNITRREELQVVAEAGGAEIQFSQLLLREANHNLLNGDAVINGGLHTFLAGRMVNDLPFIGNTLTISMADGGPEIYLGSVTAATIAPVPLPAPALLLLGGIAVLGAASRRKRADA